MLDNQTIHDRFLKTMRIQAWEKAKGELNAMMHTFWGGDDGFGPLDKVVRQFIKKVEDEGLAE